MSDVMLVHRIVGAHADGLADSLARMAPSVHIVVVRRRHVGREIGRVVVGARAIGAINGIVLLKTCVRRALP